MGKNSRRIRSQLEKFEAGELSRGAKLLATELEELGISQVETADRLECHPGFVNHLLRGRKTPSRTMAVKIRDTFGVAIEAWDE